MANQAPYEDLETGGDVYRRRQLYYGCTHCLIGTAFHPLNYADILMQLGYEPLPLTLGKRWIFFGSQVSYYPNVISYVKHMKRRIGFLGLYNGVGESLCGSLLDVGLTLTLSHYIDDLFPQHDIAVDETFSRVCSRFIKTNVKRTLAKAIGVTVSRPFKVVMIRKMAQFIGGETFYSGFFGGFQVTYADEGVKGLFAGLVPHLIRELCIMWISSLVMFMFEKLYNHYFVDPDEDDYENIARNSQTGQLVDIISPLYVTNLFHPFDVVSTVMTVNGSRLPIGGPPSLPIFAHWMDCWNHLASRSQLKRGAGYFWRVNKVEPLMKRI